MPITFATATHTGLVRRGNEDAFFARPPVFAVADGMGGAQAGEVASAMAVGCFQYFLPQTAEPDKELASLIARANQEIFGFASSGSGREGMGTTITAAVISGGRVALGHVGDSRAWLLRDGGLTRLTEDHSLVAEMVREGQLSEAEAAGHPQRSVITRALGVDADVQVDTDLVDWRPGDVFLLASDGLHGLVPEERIREILAGSDSLGRAARELVEAANAGGGNDNITVVLFNPDGSVPGEEKA
ncbi:MAG: Stp1/IreP family PP2C-type Ser/Thr phosphatase, partial [Pseudomonadota bacterium]